MYRYKCRNCGKEFKATSKTYGKCPYCGEIHSVNDDDFMDDVLLGGMIGMALASSISDDDDSPSSFSSSDDSYSGGGGDFGGGGASGDFGD